MKHNSHLLVIRLSAMGDVAMTIPVLKELTKTYPQLKITVLTKAFFAPIFQGLDHVEVYVADVKGKHKGIKGLWGLYKALKGLHIDAVADLHNVLRSNILKRFFLLGGTPVVQINKGRKDKKALTAVKNKEFKPLKTTHQRYADVFEHLGFTIHLSPGSILTKIALPKNGSELMGSEFKKWIGVAPFAAFDGKMYPPQLMEEVLEALDKTDRYKIVLFGGGVKEKLQLDQWESKYEHCVNAVGALSFKDELALISNLDLMLSMDSGNAHLAANYGIPTITLWGVTHPYSGFYPYGQDPSNAILSDREKYPGIPTSVYGNKVMKGYENVMQSIPPFQVVQKINSVLE